MINETAEVRAQVRRTLWKTGEVTAVRNDKAPEGKGNEFKPYFQFKELAHEIRPHRILALNRGEKEGFLKVKLAWPAELIQQTATTALAEHLLKIAGTPTPAPKPVPPPPRPRRAGAARRAAAGSAESRCAAGNPAGRTAEHAVPFAAA